jgi:tRNA1(Val) A37 N6-methylase TrmN6
MTVLPPLYIYDDSGEYTKELMRFYRPEPPRCERDEKSST